MRIQAVPVGLGSGPLASPTLSSVNAGTPGQVLALATAAIGTTWPTPEAVVLEYSFGWTDMPPTCTDFAITASSLSDAGGFTPCEACLVIAEVDVIGGATEACDNPLLFTCPEDPTCP